MSDGNRSQPRWNGHQLDVNRNRPNKSMWLNIAIIRLNNNRLNIAINPLPPSALRIAKECVTIANNQASSLVNAGTTSKYSAFSSEHGKRLWDLRDLYFGSRRNFFTRVCRRRPEQENFFSARRAWPSTLAGDFVTIGEKYVDSSTHYGNVPSHIKRRRSYRTIRKRILKEIGIKSFLGTIKENETYQIFVQNFSNYSILLPHGSILSSIDLHCQLIAKISDDLQVEFPSEHFIQTKIETPFVDPVYATSLLQLLSDFKDLFAEKNSGLGNTGLIKLTIDTQGKGPIWLIPYKKQKTLLPKLGTLTDTQWVIALSKSNYGSSRDCPAA